MSDKPPFDAVKASFYLIAGIIAVHCLVVLLGAGMCLYFAKTVITNVDIVCDPKSRLSELLSAALAAALAFAGGFTRNPPPPPPPRGDKP